MATPDSSHKPQWGDTPEFRAYCANIHSQDPVYTTLPSLARPELEKARQEGAEAYAEYLNALSGIGTFAVKGTIHIPKKVRAFGEWHIDLGADFVGTEEAETQDDFPYVKGRAAYTIQRAHVKQDGGVQVIAEADVEDGAPVVMYPFEMERFDIYKVRVRDILKLREQKHLASVLRFLGAVSEN